MTSMTPTLTIFTPTFNRAHTLKRTYESLCSQTCRDFCWLIIDDGSSDNTRDLVIKWKQEKQIAIQYIYQENQGMHGAHNTAYRHITTELNTCIDSDDYMPSNAVEKILDFWKKNGSDKYAGMIALDQVDGGNVIGSKFPDDLKTTTLMSFYEKGGKGDKKLIYRTDIVRKYPEYPVFPDEKYVGLAYKYYLIDCDYTLLTLNEVVCIVEYQSDGSSINMYHQYWNNPCGFAFYRKACMPLVNYRRRFLVCVHYVFSSIRMKNTNFLFESPYPKTTLLAIPLGAILYFFIRYRVKNNRLMNKPQ